MKALSIFGIITTILGIIFSLLFGYMIMQSSITKEYYTSAFDGSLQSYMKTDNMKQMAGLCVLVIGPFLSITFGLAMVALGKIAKGTEALRGKLEK